MRLDEGQQEKVVTRYQAGETTKAIALSLSVTRQTVSAILDRHGVPRRYRLLGPTEVLEAKSLYEQQKLSVADIGAQLGVSTKTAYIALRAAGATMRPVGTNHWR